MKLALGTAQFGMDYGISNQFGKTSSKEVESILQYANDNGIDTIDTASSYGNSESVLGMAFPKTHNFQIITKTPVFKNKKISFKDAERLKVTLFDSLKRLKQERVTGLLIHHAEDLLVEGGEFLFRAMQELQEEGFVEKIGVSVYTEQQIDLLTEKYKFDIFQIPINVLDQRLIEGGQLAKLKERNVELHARSIYLQGLLLMAPSLIHTFFSPIKPLLYKYRKLLDSMELSPADGALCFIREIPEIDCINIGVNNLGQLRDNLSSFNKSFTFSLYKRFKEFSVKNDKYLNPVLWQIN
ncbi:MAG: aryl-alcohol dehydrogenase [Candidatus Brocadiaceae bacterium]|nr:aryl-alcohol dehydrogenase [Candidatus Brocadiaceae bacterium]